MKSISPFAAMLICALIPASAQAADENIQLSLRGCQVYAVWSGNLVWVSELDAQKEKAREELVALDQKTPSSIYALMLKNLDALWDTSAPWEQVTAVVFNDCLARRGVYRNGQ